MEQGEELLLLAEVDNVKLNESINTFLKEGVITLREATNIASFSNYSEKKREKLVTEAKGIVAALALCGVLIFAIEATSVISDEIKDKEKDKEFVNKLTKKKNSF